MDRPSIHTEFNQASTGNEVLVIAGFALTDMEFTALNTNEAFFFFLFSSSKTQDAISAPDPWRVPC